MPGEELEGTQDMGQLTGEALIQSCWLELLQRLADRVGHYDWVTPAMAELTQLGFMATATHTLTISAQAKAWRIISWHLSEAGTNLYDEFALAADFMTNTGDDSWWEVIYSPSTGRPVGLQATIRQPKLPL